MCSQYLYGIHDREGEHILEGNGWCVQSEIVGDGNGADYSAYNATMIVRLNYSYNPGGTIPERSQYHDFAKNCGRFVANSKNCKYWIIGNEMNHPIERPNGIPILPSGYASCFMLCRDEIKRAGDDNQVIIGAVAPWNNQTAYPGNDRGDWVKYLADIVGYLKIYGIIPDGISIHTYTHGWQPPLITDTTVMDLPFQDRHYNFMAYQDFMSVIPDGIPVYITETNQDGEWLNQNTGWVQTAYDEINRYNQANGYPIKCLALYRWGKFDKYHIDGMINVQLDFKIAQEKGYTNNKENTDMEIISTDGFEGDFYYYQGIGPLYCPENWIPKWVQGNQPGVFHRPEYAKKDKRIGHPEVRTGLQAASFFTVSSTHHGVLYQKFLVVPNKPVRASVWCMGVRDDGGHGMTIGIDPHGGDDFLADHILWGNWWSQYMNEWQERVWRQVIVDAIAGASGQITVFLRSVAEYRSAISASHWDDFKLEGEQSTQPPPGGGCDCPTADEIRAIVRDELANLTICLE